MSLPARLKQSYRWPLLLLIVANGLLLANIGHGLQAAAAFVLLLFLPGWAWLPPFLTQQASLAERLVLASGLSLAMTIFGTMLAVYLPGPLTILQVLIIIDALTAAGLVATWRQRRRQPDFKQQIIPAAMTTPTQPAGPAAAFSRQDPASRVRSYTSGKKMWLYLVALLLLAACLRLPHLGYAEFHEDEAEALLLGVRLLQGEDYALFLHRKGPAQVLVPVAFWLLTGRITETSARFPFALSSILSTAVIYFVGQHWFGRRAGALAGLLWAVNGYAIAFGRMVQYQALIFFLGPLALYCLYLAWHTRQPYFQLSGALLLAASLLAHFDALLLLPAAGYLAWRIGSLEGWKNGITQRFKVPTFRRSNGSPLRATLLALLFLGVLLASFYIPYLLDPEFKHTATYLANSRIKPGLLYNNLITLRRLDKDYSSRFYLPLLALGLLWLLLRQSRHLPRTWRWVSVGLGLLAVSSLWLPHLWQAGSSSLALLPWLLLGLLYFWFEPETGSRAAWLMFGAAFIGYTFLVDDPRTHLYMMYPGVILLAGAGWATGWQVGRLRPAPQPKGSERWQARRGTLVGSILTILHSTNLRKFGVAVIIMLWLITIVVYEQAIFSQTESALARLRERWPGSAWATIYADLPGPRNYFGYPKREGWKAIGALRAQGMFSGDFRSVNEDFVIPIWYNYGEARSCYDTPAYFFVRASGEEIPAQDQQNLAHYGEVGQVQREGEVRLHILAAGAAPADPLAVYSLEALEASFDRLATPQQFIHQAEPSQPVGTEFGPAIQFLGYDLPTTTTAPGETLYLNLYWQALTAPGDNYRAFVHLTDGANLWAQQDDTPVCRLPTSIWRAGQRGVGQFRLALRPDTPPGRYPLIIGLYQADTLERLKIVGGAGQIGDDFLWLGDIEVIKP